MIDDIETIMRLAREGWEVAVFRQASGQEVYAQALAGNLVEGAELLGLDSVRPVALAAIKQLLAEGELESARLRAGGGVVYRVSDTAVRGLQLTEDEIATLTVRIGNGRRGR